MTCYEYSFTSQKSHHASGRTQHNIPEASDWRFKLNRRFLLRRQRVRKGHRPLVADLAKDVRGSKVRLHRLSLTPDFHHFEGPPI